MAVEPANADEVEALRAELAKWQAAAQDTAHTCTVTLDRIMELDAVVKAAIAWRNDRFNEHDGTPTANALAEQVDSYLIRRRKAS